MKDFENLNDAEMEYAIMTGEFGSEVRQVFYVACIDGEFGKKAAKPEAIAAIKEHLRTGYPLDVCYTTAESANGRPKNEAKLEVICRKP